MLRLPISDFSYEPATQKSYRYGTEWVPKGVDKAVGPVVHEGVKMRASQWLRLYGRRKEEEQ